VTVVEGIGKTIILNIDVFSGVLMPLVEIKWFKGRDDATKAKTIELVTKAICEGCGCAPDAVTVIIQDVDRASWGRGGKAYS
jgi:4-oxalocrotonate tautomerase